MEQKKQNQQDTKQDYIEFINKMIADMSTNTKTKKSTA